MVNELQIWFKSISHSMYWIVLLGTSIGCHRAPSKVPLAADPIGNTEEHLLETTDVIVPKRSGPKLRVTVSGARSEQGVYSVAMFDNQGDFESRTNPVMSTTLPTSDGGTWELSVSPGKYALAVFHDENENGELDRHSLGFPTEAYGFSNNARAKFGPPSYADAEFEVTTENIEMKISVK